MEKQVANDFMEPITRRWWTLLIRGLAAIAFGILAFTRPGTGLMALVVVWGAYALIDGFFELVLAVNRGRTGERWGWYFFEGLVSIGAGIVTFAWPGITAIVLVTLIGVWALLTGIAEIVAAVELRHVIKGEWILAATGVLSILFALMLFWNPRAGALSVVWIIGTYAIVFGALLVGLAFRVKQWRESGAVHTGGTPSFA